MGLLDDAIREHLELKRRRGADAVDISRQESEALGPVRRFPDGAPDLPDTFEPPADDAPPPPPSTQDASWEGEATQAHSPVDLEAPYEPPTAAYTPPPEVTGYEPPAPPAYDPPPIAAPERATLAPVPDPEPEPPAPSIEPAWRAYAPEPEPPAQRLSPSRLPTRLSPSRLPTRVSPSRRRRSSIGSPPTTPI